MIRTRISELKAYTVVIIGAIIGFMLVGAVILNSSSPLLSVIASNSSDASPPSSSKMADGCYWHLEIVPTMCEIQELLIDRGYDVGEDGVDCDIGTDTKTAWNKAICDQVAVKFSKGETYGTSNSGAGEPNTVESFQGVLQAPER